MGDAAQKIFLSEDSGMATVFRSHMRWLPFFALTLPMLFVSAGESCAAESGSPKKGFIMDLDPFLGQNGRLRAIAPGCRAMTGMMGSQPFVWSRDSGLSLMNIPETSYGMGEFLSDDGRVVTGFLSRSESRFPLPPGQVWGHSGFVWQPGGQTHELFRRGILDVDWRGLSADGRLAAGKGQEPVPGAPREDAPWEEQKRFAETPQGREAMSRGYVYNRPFWFTLRGGTTLKELDDFYYETSLPSRILSRDGKKMLRTKGVTTYVLDLQSGNMRELTFGKAIASGLPQENSIVRAGDPGNPLFRWGQERWMAGIRRQHEIIPESEVGGVVANSPMFFDWHVKEIRSGVPNFDAGFVLCDVRVERFDEETGRVPRGRLEKFNVMVRLDEKGNGVPIDDSCGGLTPWMADISDNGRIILYMKGNDFWIWDEDFRRENKVFPTALPFLEYLAFYGITLPPDHNIVTALMSPDGRCFYGELSENEDGSAFPYRSFLACTGGDITPPLLNPEGERKGQ